MNSNPVLSAEAPVTGFEIVESQKSPFKEDTIFHNILRFIDGRSLPKLRLVSAQWNRTITKVLSQDYIVRLQIDGESKFDRLRQLTEIAENRGDNFPLVNFRLSSTLNVFCDELTNALRNFWEAYAPLMTHLDIDTSTLFALFPDSNTASKHYSFPNMNSFTAVCRISNMEQTTRLLKTPCVHLKRMIEESPKLKTLRFDYKVILEDPDQVKQHVCQLLSVLNGVRFENLISVEIDGNYFGEESLSTSQLCSWKLTKLMVRIISMDSPTSLFLLLSTVNNTLLELDLVCKFKDEIMFPVVVPPMIQLEKLIIRYEEPVPKNTLGLKFESYQDCFPKLKTIRLPLIRVCFNHLFSRRSEETHLEELDYIQNAMSQQHRCSAELAFITDLLNEISKTYPGLKKLTLHTILPIEIFIESLVKNKNLTHLTIKNSTGRGKLCKDCHFSKNVYCQMADWVEDGSGDFYDDDEKSAVELEEIVVASQHRIRALSCDLRGKLPKLQQVLIRCGREYQQIEDRNPRISKWEDRIVFKISLVDLGFFTCRMETYDIFNDLAEIYILCGSYNKSYQTASNDSSPISSSEDLKTPETTAMVHSEAFRLCQQNVEWTHPLQIDSVVLEILKKFHVWDLLKLRLVCKSWNAMARGLIRQAVYAHVEPFRTNSCVRKLTEMESAIRIQGQECPFVNLRLSDIIDRVNHPTEPVQLPHFIPITIANANRRIEPAQRGKMSGFFGVYGQVLQRLELTMLFSRIDDHLNLMEIANDFNFPQLHSLKILMTVEEAENVNIWNFFLRKSPNLRTLELNYFLQPQGIGGAARLNTILSTINVTQNLDSLILQVYSLEDSHYEALANLNLKISTLELRFAILPTSFKKLYELLSTMTDTLYHLRIKADNYKEISVSTENVPIMKKLTTLRFPSATMNALMNLKKSNANYGKQFPQLKLVQIDDQLQKFYWEHFSLKSMPPIRSLEEIILPREFYHYGWIGDNLKEISPLFPNLKRLTVLFCTPCAFSGIFKYFEEFGKLEEITIKFDVCVGSFNSSNLSWNEIRSKCYPCLIYHQITERLKYVPPTKKNYIKIMRKRKMILSTLMLSVWKVSGLKKLTLICLRCMEDNLRCMGCLDHIEDTEEEEDEDSQSTDEISPDEKNERLGHKNTYDLKNASDFVSDKDDQLALDSSRIAEYDKLLVGARILKIEITEFGSYHATFYDQDRSFTELGGTSHQQTQC